MVGKKSEPSAAARCPAPCSRFSDSPGPGPSASVALRAEAVKVHTLLGSRGQPEGPRV